MTPDQLAAIKASATRPRRTVPIVLDGDLAEKIRVLLFEQEIGEASANDKRLASKVRKRAAEIDAELDQLYAQAEASTLNVVVEGLRGTDFTAFKAEHPSRPDNTADVIWGFNVEDGRDPLIRLTQKGHRSGDDPNLHPIEELDWLLGFMTEWQRETLFIAAAGVCRGDDSVPPRRASSTTQTSGAE